MSLSGIHDYVFFKGSSMRFVVSFFSGIGSKRDPDFVTKAIFFAFAKIFERTRIRGIWDTADAFPEIFLKISSDSTLGLSQDHWCLWYHQTRLIPFLSNIPWALSPPPPPPQKGMRVEAPDRTQKAKFGQCSRIWNRIFKFFGYDSGV
jgi:hypothetical protein